MEQKTFLVSGSAQEPYEVKFVRRSESHLSAYCTCPAGQNGQYCKHRFGIMDGAMKNIVSDNVNDVEIVKSWVPGTVVDQALQEMRVLEKEAAKIKRKLIAAKKEVAKAMRQ